MSLLLSGTARADFINVSKVATGTEYIFSLLQPSSAANGAVYTFYGMGRGRVSGDSADTFSPGPWTAAWTNWMSSPSINRFINNPAPYVDENGRTVAHRIPIARAAFIDTASNPEIVRTQTWGTGSAETALSYSVKVDHIAAGTHDYFVKVKHPAVSRHVQAAFRIEPGYNGGTYVYYAPESARSRSSVDVYVDGLPVWSSSSQFLYPEGNAPYAYSKLENRYGATLNGGETTLYLGKLSTGKSMVVSFVVRTDANATAPKCGNATYGYLSDVEINCYDLRETISLSPVTNSNISMRVYATQPLVVVGRSVPLEVAQ